MVYRYNQITKKDISKLFIVAIAALFALSLMVGMFGVASAAKKTTPTNAGSIGKVTFDTDVFATEDDEMDYGDGIPNGEWIVAETQGVQLGARITNRKVGPQLEVNGDRGNRVGVYEAATGTDGADLNRAEWNYEWSVDLSNARGNAKGKTFADYKLVLEQDYTEQSLFGLLGYNPVNLIFGQAPLEGTCDVYTVVLCQQSYNPTFGNDDFELDAVGTYNLRFVLTPSTFNGPSVAVTVQVVVTEE